MCDPTGGYLTVAATVLQTVGQVSQAMSASKTAKTNAQIARNNQSIKEQAARDAIQRGADTAADARQKARAATASFRAKGGSSGFLVDTGSNLDIEEQNAGVGEMNALTIQNNAEREAYGFKVGAMNDANDAARYSAESRSAMTNGLLKAGTTLVTGAANSGAGGLFNNAGKVGEGLPWQQLGYKNPQGGFYY
jgi:hypothetical protein